MTDRIRNRFSTTNRWPVPAINSSASAQFPGFQGSSAASPSFLENNYHNTNINVSANLSDNRSLQPVNDPIHSPSIHMHNQVPNFHQNRPILPNFLPNINSPQNFANQTVPVPRNNFNFATTPLQNYENSERFPLRHSHISSTSLNSENYVPFHHNIPFSRQPGPNNVPINSSQTFNFPPPTVPPPVRNSINAVNYSNPTHLNHLRFPPPLPSTSLSRLPKNATFSPSRNNIPNTFMPPPLTAFSKPPPPVPLALPEQQRDGLSVKESMLNYFLQKFNTDEKKKTKFDITIAEFRHALKRSILLSKRLQSCIGNLTSNIHVSEEEWEKEMKSIAQLKNQLNEASKVLTKDNSSIMQKKLKLVKKKREYKKRHKKELSVMRTKKAAERELLNQEIDKWLDCIKEKNLKLKREVEMKKEADNILSEVRRKIQEAKKTIEKIKVLEKLRLARQTNAEKKGLYVTHEYSLHFDEKVHCLRTTMHQQLKDYEGEEHALRVMLETEQEGQLEEEALWRIRKMKTLQLKRQKNILECLFGNTEEPPTDDPLFFFFQHQNSGNTSIDNLINIRHQWDVLLSAEGESISHQWVVPIPPSNQTWESVCKDR